MNNLGQGVASYPGGARLAKELLLISQAIYHNNIKDANLNLLMPKPYQLTVHTWLHLVLAIAT